MSHLYMHARQRLEALEEMSSEVARLRRDVRRLEQCCSAAGISRYGNTVAGSGMGKEELWIRLCDQRTALAEKEAGYREQEQQVCSWIDQLPRPRWRMVLRCRYLEGMPMADIPEALEAATGRSFSVSQIYRLHAQALKAAEELWPDS